MIALHTLKAIKVGEGKCLPEFWVEGADLVSLEAGSRSGLVAKSVRIPLHTLKSFPSQSRLVITRIIMAVLLLSNLWRRVCPVLVLLHLLDMVVGVV